MRRRECCSAYELAPEKFGDRVDEMGRPLPNGIADVLDEAKWGLDTSRGSTRTPIISITRWPTIAITRVGSIRTRMSRTMAGARTVIAWCSLPMASHRDSPKHKSEATGIANLAGRYAAAMATGAHRGSGGTNWATAVFADKCLQRCQGGVSNSASNMKATSRAIRSRHPTGTWRTRGPTTWSGVRQNYSEATGDRGCSSTMP